MAAPSGTFRLFRLFGVNVFLHWSWFIILALQVDVARRGGGLFAEPFWHVGLFLALFVIVTMHEFGHALACRSVGGRADRIVLWPLGGVAFVQPPQRPGPVLWSIAAGPLVNVALVPVTLLAAAFMLRGRLDDPSSWSDGQTFAVALAGMNLMLLVFNMLPVYPLDGGQIVQAILWFFVGWARSLLIAATVGLAVACIGGAAALYVRDWWLVLIAAFIGWKAYEGRRIARMLAA